MAFENVELKSKCFVWVNLIGFFLLVCHIKTSQASGGVIEITPASLLKQLKDDLLKTYDIHIRPVKNTSIPVTVKLFFQVTHIINMDEKYQTLKVRGQLMLEWKDEFLTWDPKSYGGLTFAHFKPSMIWLPDVQCGYNLKAEDHQSQENRIPVMMYYNGTAKWHPYVILDVPCSANYRHYPFDSHRCEIQFAGWNHPGRHQDFRVADFPVSTEVLGAEWRLTKEQQISETLSKNKMFPSIRVDLDLERVSSIHRYICVLPTFYTFSSTLVGFWLLAKETSRYLIGFSNIILTSLLLQYLALTVPAGNEIPLLAQYSATCLCMSGVFVLITVAAHDMGARSGPLPRYLVRVAPTMEPWLRIPRAPLTDDQQPPANNWPRLAMVVDRLAFGVFGLVYVILLAVLASI